MRSWGYATGAISLFLSIFIIALASVSIVLIEGSTTVDYQQSARNFAIVSILLALATIAVASVGVYKIFKANQTYERVITNAKTPSIEMSTVVATKKALQPVVETLRADNLDGLL